MTFSSQKQPSPIIQPKDSQKPSPVDFWGSPAVIQPNNFVYKSLSNWAFNIAVGCSHACRFCYVPSAATIKQSARLATYGVNDPDEEWGQYVLLRPWDEDRFLASLRAAEKIPQKSLKPDGNRAVIYCSTTDPYQVIRHPDPLKQKSLQAAARHLVRRSLELIRDNSTLNVRILTRSPLAALDFELFSSFGSRLLFGMSIPTLRNDLSKIYEPKAPAPSQRLATLKAAKARGLNIYVAMAPTYPECDDEDLRATLTALATLDPGTIFHEPINIRAENVARISAEAKLKGFDLKTEVFATREAWQTYALASLKSVSTIAKDLGIHKSLHLWPDKSLGSQDTIKAMPRPEDYQRWLQRWWQRISYWPSQA